VNKILSLEQDPSQGPYVRPLPDITAENRPFWDGLKKRQFLVPKCRSCGDWNWTPYPACRSCLSEDLEWKPVSGLGKVYSFCITHRGASWFAPYAPYAWGWVELDESPRPLLVMTNFVGCAAEDLRIDMRVKVEYEDIAGEDVTLYRFALA